MTSRWVSDRFPTNALPSLQRGEAWGEERTELATLPVITFQHSLGASAAFRSFVMDDYTRLMSGLFTRIDEVAFTPLKQRLAHRLLAEANL